MTANRIVVTLPLEPEGKDRLEKVLPGYEIFYEVPDDMTGVCAVIGKVPSEKLKELSSLRWVQLSMAGTEPYSLPGVLPNGTILTNATGAFGLAISEYMVGCVFELYKKLHLYRDNQQKCLWLDRGNVKRVERSVVLVLGMGDIGGQFARRMKALGAYIIGVRRTEGICPEWCDEIYTVSALDSLLPRADILAMSLPGTPETRGIMNRERLALMKSDAILINVGRGNAVDTAALTEALNEGRLGGCALDVTDPEPLPADDPIWKCENAVITPHISGFFHLRDTYDNIVDICIENARRFACGEELMNVVDFSTGYKVSSHS